MDIPTAGLQGIALAATEEEMENYVLRGDFKIVAEVVVGFSRAHIVILLCTYRPVLPCRLRPLSVRKAS